MRYEEYLQVIEKEKEKLFAAADAVWEAAETAFSEEKSAEVLCRLLAEEGFAVTRPAFGIGTAFTASFGSGKPVMGFLGEYDALANLSQVEGLTEKKALVPGANGHGCGHNLLGVGAVAAAMAVKEYLEKTGKPGTVVYFGCPGEEGGSGKAFMAREGAFDDLDFAITWHPGSANLVSTGSSLANFQVLFKFNGISAHAAGCPEMGRSALDALEIMNVGSNFLREHIISSARLHYAILDSGGYSPNVVQNHAEVLYLIRAPKLGQAKEIYDRVVKVAQGAAWMTETTMEYELIKSCANVVPNNVMEEVMFDALCDVPVPEYTEEERAQARAFTATVPAKEKFLQGAVDAALDPNVKAYLLSKQNADFCDFVLPYSRLHIESTGSGSTDVGDVSWQTPTVQMGGASWAPHTPAHSWQATAQGKSSTAHKSIVYAGQCMAATALRMYEDPALIAAAREELNTRLEGETYVPIPEGIYPRAISELTKK
ncbi:MAG: amidohydrolase [Clostridia bacterium]|nr:amidohydrolase [Clostridia bacterium]